MADSGLWRFVPVAGYGVPGLPVAGTLRRDVALLGRFFGRRGEDLEPVKREGDLRRLDEERLSHLLRGPDWGQVAAALDLALGEWPSVGEPGVRFLVGQPYAGHGEIVRAWGDRRGATGVVAPTPEEVLAGAGGWLEQVRSIEGPWVLPNLEHCYLRHARGLGLVRALLEGAESGRLGCGLIACGSWAWAYLQQVWPVVRSDALTVAAFDGAGLTRLFSALTASPTGQPVCYRNARTGAAILTIPGGDGEARPELVQLAAQCRGNFGIALHGWRARLRTEPEREGNASGGESEAASGGRPAERVVWVTPDLLDPPIPLGKEEDPLLLLHALLLHGGLPESLLPEVLPLPRAETMAVLLRLRNAGLARLRGGRWMVPESAYAGVRELLRGRDYLVDPF